MKPRDGGLIAGSRVIQAAATVLVLLFGLASSQAGTITTVHSTVPSNGDLNPYGVAVVPSTTGALVKGNILISNFNNSSNLQGTGTTIVQISPSGQFSLFAQIDPTKLPGPCPGGVGLTTALVALRSGWVIVGSLPTKDGTSATAKSGCLLVVNSNGQVVETFANKRINGPWDMTAADFGKVAELFVTNVLNGTVKANGKIVHRGTIERLVLAIPEKKMPKLVLMTKIGSGFAERTDSAALVIGPTGVGLSLHDHSPDDNGVLYVSDSLNNRIAAIDNPLFRDDSAGTGRTVTKGGVLNDPLGLTVAPNGDILTVNGGDGYLLQTRHRHQINKALLDDMGSPPGAGALFGLAFVSGQGVYFVDDNENALNLFQP